MRDTFLALLLFVALAVGAAAQAPSSSEHLPESPSSFAKSVRPITEPPMSAAPPSPWQRTQIAQQAAFKSKEEKAAADQVAELFRKMREEKKLEPLERFNTLD